MSSHVIFDLCSDIHSLYCKTGSREIEKEFIKLSQVNLVFLKKWMGSKHPKEQGVYGFDAFAALNALIKVRGSMTGEVASKDVAAMMVGDNALMRQVPVIVSFADILSSGSSYSVLDPFSDIVIAVASVFTPAFSVDLTTLQEEVAMINSSFNEYYERTISDEYSDYGVQTVQKKETLEQKKINLFSYVLNRLTEDVAQAASNTGMEDFANALRSRGVLANPVAMSDYIGLGHPTSYMLSRADRIAKDLFKNIKSVSGDVAYNHIKNEALSFVRVVTKQEVSDVFNQRERDYDMSAYMRGEQPEQDEEGPTLTIEDAKWLDPDGLTMLSLVFVGMHNRLKGRSY